MVGSALRSSRHAATSVSCRSGRPVVRLQFCSSDFAPDVTAVPRFVDLGAGDYNVFKKSKCASALSKHPARSIDKFHFFFFETALSFGNGLQLFQSSSSIASISSFVMSDSNLPKY